MFIKPPEQIKVLGQSNYRYIITLPLDITPFKKSSFPSTRCQYLMLLKGRENHQLDLKALSGLFPHCSLSRPNPPSFTAATLNYLSHSFSAGYRLCKAYFYIMSPVPSCVPLTTQARSANPTDDVWDLSVSAATLELSVLWTGSNPLLQTLQAPSPVFHTYLQCYNVIDYWNKNFNIVRLFYERLNK